MDTIIDILCTNKRQAMYVKRNIEGVRVTVVAVEKR
jgi:hypothetical protein